MNNRRQIFGWALYDWANSAYITTVTVAILPAYFADGIVGEQGFTIFGTVMSAQVLWSYMITAAAVIAFMFAPVLGAIADFSASKKRFLQGFCYAGSLATILLYLCGSGDVWMTMVFFIIAQIGFIGGNVFYDAFLPQIAGEDTMDWVSGKGYAYGYVGGGLQFLLSLLFFQAHEALGLNAGEAAQIILAFTGLWWLAFGIVSFRILREESVAQPIPPEYGSAPGTLDYIKIGFKRTWATTKKVRRFRHLLLFLVAFMIYNDGIQTVITMATIYGKEELALETGDLMMTVLVIQFIAFFGALLFGKIGEKIGAKTAIILTLLGWCGIVVYAYFMTTAMEYFMLGGAVGIVMGGSQSLSRSLYGSMIPPNASAEFYGFYSVFNKFSSIWGPLVFGIITQLSGSSRAAILALIVFFIVGIILLSFVNISKAREAKLKGAF